MARGRLAGWLVSCSALVACAYYDRSLLDPVGDNEAPGGEAGGAGKGGAGASGAGAGGAGAGASGAGAGGAGAGGAGASGAGGAGGGAGGQVCQLVKPPAPPTMAKSGGDLELFMALRKIDLGETLINGKEAYKGFGFDLDGYCTCPAAPSCKGLDASPTRYCDGEGGRDNAGGALIALISKFAPKFSTLSFNEQLADGVFSVLLRVRGYNGEASDDQIELTWLMADSFAIGHTPLAKPLFDGSDDWAISDASFEKVGGVANLDSPLYTDKNAYVTDYTVVGSLPGGALRFAEFSLELTSPFFVGKLVPPGGASPIWTSPEATIAARWKTRNVLAQMGSFVDPLQGKPLCTDNSLFSNFKGQICQYADILSTVAQPNMPCDAVSLGVKVEAVQAKMGAVVPSLFNPSKCPPATDPASASCDAM